MRTICKILLPALVLTGVSCQKVINVKIKSAVQQYVIEGEITDGPGPYMVKISRTRDFTENNNFDQVSGARVTVRDIEAGTTDTLRETTSGTYHTSKVKGIPGHNYVLGVLVNGQAFTASSVMPVQAIAIDTLYAGRSTFGGEDVFMTAVFTDPPGKGNYYRIRQWVRGLQVNGSRVRSDEATDGFTYRSQLFYDTEDDAGNPLIHSKDSISAELQCLNRQVYDYYRTLQDATGDNSATPANPLSNITGGALGVFNTCTSRKKTAVAIY
jgi:hypothetical protein